MRLKTMLTSALAICMLTACENIFEDGGLEPDGSKPSVKINNPSNNQTISSTQGLRVNVTVVDKDQIKDLEFTVKGLTSETALVKFKKFPAKTVVEFDTTLSIQGISPGEYKLMVAASDKRTNLEQREITFTVK
jgi:hypothetical protein